MRVRLVKKRGAAPPRGGLGGGGASLHPKLQYFQPPLSFLKPLSGFSGLMVFNFMERLSGLSRGISVECKGASGRVLRGGLGAFQALP